MLPMNVVEPVSEFFRQNEELRNLFVSVLHDAAQLAGSTAYLSVARGFITIGFDNPLPDADWGAVNKQFRRLFSGGQQMTRFLQASKVDEHISLSFRSVNG